jgi:flagellar biosynthesis protein FlhG
MGNRFLRFSKLKIPEIKRLGKKILSTSTSRAREMYTQSQKLLTRTIAVTSGKGGVGKSHFTANLAIKMAENGKNVMVLDADLGLANLDILFGIFPKYSLLNVIRNEKDIRDVVAQGPGGVRIIPGGSGLEELADLDENSRKNFLSSLEQIEDDLDILIIDTGAGLSKNVLSFLNASEEIIVLSTPEPSSLADAYGVIKSVVNSDPDADIKVVVNRVTSEEEAREVFRRLSMVSRQFINHNLKWGGFIYEDRIVSNAVRQREPFVLLNRESKASVCMENICTDLLDIEMHQSEKKGFFNKVASIFS